MNKVLIIDLSHLYVKYFYVSMYNYESKGMDVVHKSHMQGLFRFFSLIHKNNSDFKNIYVVMDGKLKDTDNKGLFEDYKEGRTKIDGIHKNEDKFISLLSMLPRITVLRNNNREADDVIAYMAMKLCKNNKVIIHSGDKDFLQLTSIPNIFVSDKYNKGKFITFTDEEIFDKFKNNKKESFTRISSNKNDILKYRVFKGDASDNIPPAIPRLLDKDIAYLIQNCWKQEYLNKEVFYNIVDTVEKDSLKQKLKDNRDNIFRNYQLMNLKDRKNDSVIINETKKIKSKLKSLDDAQVLVTAFGLDDFWSMMA